MHKILVLLALFSALLSTGGGCCLSGNGATACSPAPAAVPAAMYAPTTNYAPTYQPNQVQWFGVN